MAIYSYEEAFGAADQTSRKMRAAIQNWFELYYGAAGEDQDPCQRVAYSVVCKLVRTVFGEYQATAGEDDRQENARWLLALQDWVQQQSLAGLAPRLGDVPHRQRIRAEQGRLKAPAQTGTGRYAVTITANYAVMVDNYDEQ